MKQRIRKYGWIALSALLIVSGCGNGGADSSKETAGKEELYNNEPVTLTFYSHYAGILGEADLEALVAKPVKAKFPNISVQLISGTTLDKLITAGEVPDVILTSNYYLHDLLQQGLGSDLNDMVKSHNIDMSQFEPEAINLLKKFGKNGEIYGMPYAMNYGVMAYNKDIFDKFAVPYPKDNMTWNEVIELARKVTREDQGTQYIGLDPGDPQVLTRAYSLPVVNDKQDKSVLTNDAYKKVFGLFERLYSITGIVGPNNKYTYGIDYFLKDQKLAMFPYWIANLTTRLPQLQEQGKNFNWDVVSFPSFDDKPGYGREIDFHLAMVTPTGKNKKAVYAVLQTLVSEEAQKAMNKGMRLTVLKDQNLKKQFASDTKLYEGKNLEGIFKVKPAPLPEATKFDVKIYPFLKEAAKGVATEKKDINTALREAEEKADKFIKEEGLK
ncbi:extracellular solute-binding protein [Paenibacillus sp. GD4]|uniref:ABC transporter substrate-binding protein n=1 Tax=Paenibacillus sp. GD4 TaxID=3068890 RepID=UPI002796D602|nr:extracellular solute-binding protein [Paenibacillus sp. GD4]MDQ1913986.1 extracellular solute-binding protein [Paenibacillus sp. GD4]